MLFIGYFFNSYAKISSSHFGEDIIFYNLWLLFCTSFKKNLFAKLILNANVASDDIRCQSLRQFCQTIWLLPYGCTSKHSQKSFEIHLTYRIFPIYFSQLLIHQFTESLFWDDLVASRQARGAFVSTAPAVHSSNVGMQILSPEKKPLALFLPMMLSMAIGGDGRPGFKNIPRVPGRWLSLAFHRFFLHSDSQNSPHLSKVVCVRVSVCLCDWGVCGLESLLEFRQ